MIPKILPYKRGSASARLLSQHLGQLLGRKVWRVTGNYRVKPLRDIIVNWGSHTVLNHPNIKSWNGDTRIARNKLATFQLLRQHNVPTVEWSTNLADAINWINEKPVYFRYSLEGQGGSGILLVKTPEDMAGKRQAPLYTKYFPARREYRVHVAFGEVIDYAAKKKRNGVEGNKFLRNHDNGYVYARTDVAVPACVSLAATQAVVALGLDFGAVDVLHNEKDDRAAVLEINTAPGLDNHTAERYARAFAARLARV